MWNSYVNEYIEYKRRNKKIYYSELEDLNGIVMPKQKEGNFHALRQFIARIKIGILDKVLESLKKTLSGM